MRAGLNIDLEEDKVIWSMSDFDKALTNAMKEICDARHGGCEFYLLKALKPKLALLGQGSSERVQELGPVLDAVHHTRAA